MKAFILSVFFALSSLYASSEVTGFWKSINEKTGMQESVVAVYEYEGKLFGRLIVLYDDKGMVKDSIADQKLRAPGLPGYPYYSGLDIMWDLVPAGKKYGNGKVLDPEHGKVYDAEIWKDKDNLIVRGKILFFGRNQKWVQATDEDFPPNFKKPNIHTFQPKIPKVK
jgi:uncharacterized protein (DUF2147 family)